MIKAQIAHQIPTQSQGLFMNTRRPTFAQAKVREALGLMFDFEWTNRTLFSSAYKRTVSYYPNSEFSATGVPVGSEWLMLSPYRDQLPANLLTQASACRRPTVVVSRATPYDAPSPCSAKPAGNCPGSACWIAKGSRCVWRSCW